MPKSLPQSRDHREVHFVRGPAGAYPKTDEDYLVLRQLRIPVVLISEDFTPMLARAGKLHNLTFIFHNFADLEQDMLSKVKAKWPFDIELTSANLVLKAPKNVKPEKVSKLLSALQTWYSRHFYSLEQVSRKSSRSIKVTLTKRRKVP